MLERLKKELIGSGLTVVDRKYIDSNNKPLISRYTIIDVYPHHVLALKILESGVEITESFSTGELVTMGVIK